MERLDELLNSCFKPKGSFHFSTMPELTDFVIDQGGILYPVSIHYTFGYYELAYLKDDTDDKDVADSIRESDFQFLEVTDLFLNQVRNNEYRRQFLTEADDDQFFYYDRQKERLFLICQILD